MAANLDDLDLPPIEQNVNGQDLVYCDEAYCRADGCHVITKFTLFANLRAHYKLKHPEIYHNFAFSSIGRPTTEAVAESIEWFEEVMEAHDRRLAARAQAKAKPPVPTKTLKGITTTNVTAMMAFINTDHPKIRMPCMSCKRDGESKACGKFERQTECDLFSYFTVDESEDEESELSEGEDNEPGTNEEESEE